MFVTVASKDFASNRHAGRNLKHKNHAYGTLKDWSQFILSISNSYSAGIDSSDKWQQCNGMSPLLKKCSWLIFSLTSTLIKQMEDMHCYFDWIFCMLLLLINVINIGSDSLFSLPISLYTKYHMRRDKTEMFVTMINVKWCYLTHLTEWRTDPRAGQIVQDRIWTSQCSSNGNFSLEWMDFEITVTEMFVTKISESKPREVLMPVFLPSRDCMMALPLV